MSKLTHKYLQIYNEIKSLILNQAYKAGDLLHTEEELCQIYKASRPTIAKALKLLSDEKMIKRRAGFGTQVMAPSLNTFTAGLLIPRLHQTEIFEPICASITETAGMAGMRIIRPPELALDSEPKELAERLTEQFIEQKVKGVFFTPIEYIEDSENFNRSIMDRLKEKGIQVVLLDRDLCSWPRQTPYDLVGIDNIEAGYVMAAHLLENGCKKLAFISPSNTATTAKLRRIGSREALVQNRKEVQSLIKIDFPAGEIESSVKKLIELGIDGLICANDVTAAPFLRALQDMGIKIPEDMQVCGFDDVKYASLLSTPLSSYRQPCKDIGKSAARAMLNRIKHPDSPIQRIYLKGEIVSRNSTRGKRS